VILALVPERESCEAAIRAGLFFAFIREREDQKLM